MQRFVDLIKKSALSRSIGQCFLWFVGTVFVYISVAVWGQENATGFYGAFAAAIVAAIAVIMGARYQARLERSREERKEATAIQSEAIELYFWLGFAANELQMFASGLRGLRDSLKSDNRVTTSLTNASFARANPYGLASQIQGQIARAVRLPIRYGRPITIVLYGVATQSSRFFSFEKLPDDEPLTLERVESALAVAEQTVPILLETQSIAATFLATQGIAVDPSTETHKKGN